MPATQIGINPFSSRFNLLKVFNRINQFLYSIEIWIICVLWNEMCWLSFPVCASLGTFVSHNVCPPLLRTADLLSVKIVKMLELNCETRRGRGSGSDTGGRRGRWGGTCRASQLRPHTGLGSLNEEQKRPISCCLLWPLYGHIWAHRQEKKWPHSWRPCQFIGHLAFGLCILDTGLPLLSVVD